MPLARIISPSAVGCRELALDLLARGYAVEIVEPDKVPDNFADLELRVEPPAVRPVSANAAVHDSGRPAPIDLVQHLREPMPTFLRRPPSKDDLIAAGIIPRPDSGVIAEIKPQSKFIAELSPQRNAAVGEISPLVPIARIQPGTLIARAKADPEKAIVPIRPAAADTKNEVPLENATPNLQLISTPEIGAPPAKGLGKLSRGRITIKIRRFQWKELGLKIASNSLVRSNGAFLRASAGFAATVALGGVLLLGVRGTDPLVQKAAANSQTEDAKSVLLPRSELQSPTAAPHVATQQLGQSAMSPKPRLKTEAPRKAVPASQKQKRHHQADSAIAKDTVTYLKK